MKALIGDGEEVGRRKVELRGDDGAGGPFHFIRASPFPLRQRAHRPASPHLLRWYILSKSAENRKLQARWRVPLARQPTACQLATSQGSAYATPQQIVA